MLKTDPEEAVPEVAEAAEVAAVAVVEEAAEEASEEAEVKTLKPLEVNNKKPLLVPLKPNNELSITNKVKIVFEPILIFS